MPGGNGTTTISTSATKIALGSSIIINVETEGCYGGVYALYDNNVIIDEIDVEMNGTFTFEYTPDTAGVHEIYVRDRIYPNENYNILTITVVDYPVSDIATAINNNINGKITTHNTNNNAHSSQFSGKADKSGGVSQITDSNAHSNIGSSANATQATINTAIDTAIGNISTIINGNGGNQ